MTSSGYKNDVDFFADDSTVNKMVMNVDKTKYVVIYAKHKQTISIDDFNLNL